MTKAHQKKFNIFGPCDPMDHYMSPALPRLPNINEKINDKEYFVFHAPRQSGKTTTILAAANQINEEGSYYSLYCSLAQLRLISDEDKAMNKIVDKFDEVLRSSKVKALKRAIDANFWAELDSRRGFKSSPLLVFLRVLTAKLDKDLVVFFDEADCLSEQPLISFLAQLRDGYIERATVPFPRTIALIGTRNIKDYKTKARPDSESLGSASPFNIAGTLTLANFTQEETMDLYAQHTAATGQVFLEEAIQRAWRWSEGQPWLVNALAREAVDETLKSDYGKSITADLIDQAADNIKKRRDTHIDSLLSRLREPRVKRVIEPMLAAMKLEDLPEIDNDASLGGPFIDDYQYCLELGLIKGDDKSYKPANPIYSSFISRYLNDDIQRTLSNDLIGKWMDGDRVDMNGLLKAFQSFWSEKSEKYLKGVLYQEAAPHLLLTAYLQRVVNGGAQVIEEYALGLGYSDIAVKYAGKNYALELKIKDNQRSQAKSQEQLLGYMDRLLTKEGWLLIFDRQSKKSWGEKITWKTVKSKDRTIHLLGL
jgi:hypothetical protein